MIHTKELEGIKYKILDSSNIRDYVIAIAKKEWEPSDFDLVGDDLYKSEWILEEVPVDKITMRADLLVSDEFMKDVTPRIENQVQLLTKGIAIPPLILRGKDLLIFDGYARTNALKKLGIKKCLAYIGHR